MYANTSTCLRWCASNACCTCLCWLSSDTVVGQVCPRHVHMLSGQVSMPAWLQLSSGTGCDARLQQSLLRLSAWRLCVCSRQCAFGVVDSMSQHCEWLCMRQKGKGSCRDKADGRGLAVGLTMVDSGLRLCAPHLQSLHAHCGCKTTWGWRNCNQLLCNCCT